MNKILEEIIIGDFCKILKKSNVQALKYRLTGILKLMAKVQNKYVENSKIYMCVLEILLQQPHNLQMNF